MLGLGRQAAPLAGWHEPGEQILPQESSAPGLPGQQAGCRSGSHSMMGLGCRMCWDFSGFFPGCCCPQHGVSVAEGGARRLRAALAKPERETQSVASIEGEGGGQERFFSIFFFFCQIAAIFQAQRAGVGKFAVKAGGLTGRHSPGSVVSVQTGSTAPLARNCCSELMKIFSVPGLPGAVMTTATLPALLKPLSHSVNALHRKVGCSHQPPSLSVCLRFD